METEQDSLEESHETAPASTITIDPVSGAEDVSVNLSQLTATQTQTQMTMNPQQTQMTMNLQQMTPMTMDPGYYQYLASTGNLHVLDHHSATPLTTQHLPFMAQTMAPTIPSQIPQLPLPQFPYQEASQEASQEKKGKKKKTVTKKKKSAMKTGGAGFRFSKYETNLLLDFIEELKPMGRVEWETLLDKFNRRVPAERERDVKSIQAKFSKLHSKQMPTGDPNMPADVRRAKKLHHLIMEASDMVDVEEMSDDDGVEVEDEEEEVEEEGLTVSAVVEEGISSVSTPAAASTTTPSSSTSRQARRKRKKTNEGNDDAFLKVFLETERMNQKRERLRMKREDRNMKMMFGLITSAISAFAPNNNSNNSNTEVAFARAAIQNALDDDDESLSSIDSSDSPPTTRKKEEAGKTKRQNTGTKTSGL